MFTNVANNMNITKTMQLSKEGSSAKLRQHLNEGNQENLDFQDEDGNTALIWAACEGHVECVELLLQKEAFVDHQDKDGNTALIGAARMGHMNIVRNLLCCKANIHLTNKSGTTAIEEASTEEIREEIRNSQGRLTKGAC